MAWAGFLRNRLQFWCRGDLFSGAARQRKLRFGLYLRESETIGLGDWNL